MIVAASTVIVKRNFVLSSHSSNTLSLQFILYKTWISSSYLCTLGDLRGQFKIKIMRNKEIMQLKKWLLHFIKGLLPKLPRPIHFPNGCLKNLGTKFFEFQTSSSSSRVLRIMLNPGRSLGESSTIPGNRTNAIFRTVGMNCSKLDFLWLLLLLLYKM